MHAEEKLSTSSDSQKRWRATDQSDGAMAALARSLSLLAKLQQERREAKMGSECDYIATGPPSAPFPVDTRIHVGIHATLSPVLIRVRSFIQFWASSKPSFGPIIFDFFPNSLVFLGVLHGASKI
jgi:hypothetical protein